MRWLRSGAVMVACMVGAAVLAVPSTAAEVATGEGRQEEVPEDIFMSEDEVNEELVADIDWSAWSDRRAEHGLSPLRADDLSLKEKVEILAREARFDMPLLAQEVGDYERWQVQRERLLDEHTRLAGDDAYLVGRIDERRLVLDVWMREGWSGAVGQGISVHRTAFSRGDVVPLVEAIQKLPAEAFGSSVEIDAIRVGEYGVRVELSSPEGVEVPRQAVNRGLSAVEAARRSLGDPMNHVPVELSAVEHRPVVDAYCLSRNRCPNVQGGMRDFSNECSSGFVLRNGNNRAISTAGHCAGSFTRFGLIGPDTNTSGNQAFAPNLTSARAPRNDGFHDIWATENADSDSLVPTYFRDQNYGNRPVTAFRVSPPQGLEVCVSARLRLERRCGIITDAAFTNNDTFGWLEIDFAHNGNQVGVQGGDSGGSVTERNNSSRAVATVANAGGPALATFGFRWGFFPRVDPIPLHYGGWAIRTGNLTTTLRESFIAGLYQTALQRRANVGEINGWVSQYSSGSCSSNAKFQIEFFMKSNELRTGVPLTSLTAAQRRVRRLYWSAFGRAADPGGLTYWANRIHNASNREAEWTWVVDYFKNSSETNVRIISRRNQEWGPCS
ncbi:MAG: hypothetical protein GY708_30150 [Actinomycetia bacterium]|nr:hypothetical protein [Actinomycetes bacterium]